jgi:tRNA dimethylallyltransferase
MSGRRFPLVVIAGPTASGKSETAMAVARAVGGEIVSGDAFAIYRGLDIGTAKPSERVRSEIPHHLIDVAQPNESFSAGRWASLARVAISEIESRGAVPIIEGGSHFYLRALLKGLPGEEVRFEALRGYWRGRERGSNRDLKRMLDVLDPAYSAKVPQQDTARLLRAIEIVLATGRRVTDRPSVGDAWSSTRSVLKIALQFTRQEIYTRLAVRVFEMWDAGWPDEVRGLLSRGVPRCAPAFRAIGYSEVASFVSGETSRDEALSAITRRTRALVKRQMTWLASEPDLQYRSPSEAIGETVRFCARSRDDR